MNWYIKGLKDYVNFNGRARRKEYWMFTLFNIIISVILSLLESVVGLAPFLTTIYSLFILLPSLAVTVRRLHDTGRSGWWILIGLIPFIGGIVLLVFACLDSELKENRFGPNPKWDENFN
ncbi:DUF805 domain-containing protein [Pseudalkalibacillus hwajinpoensis]|uniref:DUF805 domain-containing protein n=1 Tax=Guptibacillus hwajinpoensis TaxID=208199 RepID=A0A4U1MFJ4_9BACL|nr:DUF805 domain-containing protein [Pseudalkalibacillus hwajinpoensis]TKD70009.1 DUF805 domain-containing protein [Pseudalkalibacillus hwajinpoensis]